MQTLPMPLNTRSTSSTTQEVFGGINRRASAGDGDIYDMKNMGSDDYPMLATRAPNQVAKAGLTLPKGMFSLNGIHYVDGRDLKYYDPDTGDGDFRLRVESSTKTFCAFGNKIIILPDKVWYDTATGDSGEIEASVTEEVSIQDGTFAEAPAKANTIYKLNMDWAQYFKVGDAITISGSAIEANNKTIIIRELIPGSLIFDENSFVVPEGGADETLTLSRTMPDLDFICECDNRLWGCKGDTVYASKLGDITNWNAFGDGISTDSYAVDTGSPGEFTGCITYLGYPIFFKEDVIFKMYGKTPSDFQLMRSASLGVAKGCHKSLAVAGEILFYMSRTGVVAYSGATPSDIFLPFNGEKFTDCVAGSDGRKYHISMKKADGTWTNAVYDTAFQTWHIEDNTSVIDFARDGDTLYSLVRSGTSGTNGTIEKLAQSEGDEFDSYVEFAEQRLLYPGKKRLSKIALNCTVTEGGFLRILIQYDSSGEWEEVCTLEGDGRNSYYLPILPKRCDRFKLKLVGYLPWKLYGITKEFTYGSMN